MVVTGYSPSRPTDHNIHACFLPEDLVISKILPKLPVKSLMRFKCVSKKWLDVIRNDSGLVSAHLRHHSNTTKFSIILSQDSNSKRDYYRIGLFLDEPKVVESDISYIAQKYASLSIEGSSNGLVCLSHWFQHTILWNPATRKWRNIPDGPTGDNRIIGFGYDEHSKDYKLVRVSKDYYEKGSLCVQIFSTSCDSWREGKRISGYGLPKIYRKGVLINGALYWLMFHYKRQCHVFSFNLHNEELQIIDVPDRSLYYNHRFRLTKWKESLALLSSVSNNSKDWRCDVFVMTNKNIDKQIWTPIFRELLLHPYYFFGVWRDRFLVTEICQLNGYATHSYFLMNPSSSEENSQKIKEVLEPGWIFLNRAYDYVPSLVSVYPNQNVENSNKIKVRELLRIGSIKGGMGY